MSFSICWPIEQIRAIRDLRLSLLKEGQANVPSEWGDDRLYQHVGTRVKGVN